MAGFLGEENMSATDGTFNHAATRRQALAVLGAATAAAFLPIGSSRAQAPANPRRIDVHHHIWPPEYVTREHDRVLAVTSNVASLQWTPEHSLEEMDKVGIATAIVSISTPGVWFGDVAEGRSLARLSNDYAAKMVRDHRGRFGFFAALPLPDRDGSLKEIEYAFETLKADGIGLLSSYTDKWPGDPAFDAVFMELNRRKAIVYIHPTAPGCCVNLQTGVPVSTVELFTDTMRAITSLLANGTFSRYPDLRFIFSHAGGTISLLADRLQTFRSSTSNLAEGTPNGVLYELGRLYYDIASVVNPRTMAALLAMAPISQVLFGTDYPFVPVPATTNALDKFGLSAADLDAVNRGNALRLFPRLGA
jgi:predicted TIM-barrel fold metal-dependent hydrolase